MLLLHLCLGDKPLPQKATWTPKTRALCGAVQRCMVSKTACPKGG